MPVSTMAEDRRFPVYPTIQFLETLQYTEAETRDIVELRSFAKVAIHIVRVRILLHH